MWCKWRDTNKKGSIDDPTFGARNIQEIAKFSTVQKFNCKTKPLFDFLPMDHVLIKSIKSPSLEFRCFN